MTPLEFLNARRSVPSKQLGAPGPSDEQLHALLQCAVRVPDHGKLVPWRFVRIAGDQGPKLGDKLVAIQRARGVDDPAVLEKDRTRFAHAPLVLAVVGRILPGHKIPEQEQLLSGGCVCFNLLLGAQAQGFGAQWLTGWPAYDAEVGALLGLREHERVVGFIHVGTPREAAPERQRPDADALLSELAL